MAASGTARRQIKKRRWLRKVLFYLLFPLVVWFVAFLVWFHWRDLSQLFVRQEETRRPATKIDAKDRKGDKAAVAPANRPQEKILDEDRRKLEDILKQRQ